MGQSNVDTMLNTNVKGVIHGVQAFVPDMRARNAGHVIVIGRSLHRTRCHLIGQCGRHLFLQEWISLLCNQARSRGLSQCLATGINRYSLALPLCPHHQKPTSV